MLETFCDGRFSQTVAELQKLVVFLRDPNSQPPKPKTPKNTRIHPKHPQDARTPLIPQRLETLTS